MPSLAQLASGNYQVDPGFGQIYGGGFSSMPGAYQQNAKADMSIPFSPYNIQGRGYAQNAQGQWVPRAMLNYNGMGSMPGFVGRQARAMRPGENGIPGMSGLQQAQAGAAAAIGGAFAPGVTGQHPTPTPGSFNLPSGANPPSFQPGQKAGDMLAILQNWSAANR